ncbi:MAG TPA: DNA translocase FtsK [Dehalococcoidia bacterium]|nr:DNA translocase FtsK [Dehalococcoidia bacterium]
MSLRARSQRRHVRRSPVAVASRRYGVVRSRRVRRHRAAFQPWPLLLVLLAGGAGAGLVFLVPLLVAAGEALLRWLGLGLPLVAGALALDVALLRRPGARSAAFWRLWLAGHLLLAFALGALGLFEPRVGLGEVLLAEVSLGGQAGSYLSGSWPAVAAWGASAPAALVLAWPRLPVLLAKGTGVLVEWAVSLDLPHRVAGAARAVASWVGTLLPAQDEERQEWELPAPPPKLPPLVARWDEEWGQPSQEEKGGQEAQEQAAAAESKPERRRRTGNGWELPPVHLLNAVGEESKPPDNEARAQLIVDTLKSFGVDARVVSIQQGPTVTQFGIEPGWEVKTRLVPERDERGRIVYDKDGRPKYRSEVLSRTRVRVNRITALANDLALALAAPSIRIESPVPGKPFIGIEVPNTAPSVVTLRSVIESPAFQKVASRSRLAVALGKGVSGEPVAADLARMPHLLIAGATGSGKSVCINSLITCLLMHNTPEEVRLVLIDPKRVELAAFSPVPHLLFSRVIVELEEVPAVLQAVIQEMEARYRAFAAVGVRNIEAYNRSQRAPEKMPYWVVIIDELADLMMSAPYQVERQLCRLAQLARATGIHLIVATQRPSVDVVTGLIKANFPTRIAFAVSSQVDSRTILDMAGAEKLLGRGDMLYLPTDAAKPRRLQGCYVSDAEIERVVAWWADDRFRHLRPEPMDHLLEQVREAGLTGEDDPLFQAAKELAMEHNRISVSMLQRRLGIGRERALKLMGALEQAGVVAPADDPLASRRVLVRPDDELLS